MVILKRNLREFDCPKTETSIVSHSLNSLFLSFLYRTHNQPLTAGRTSSLESIGCYKNDSWLYRTLVIEYYFLIRSRLCVHLPAQV